MKIIEINAIRIMCTLNLNNDRRNSNDIVWLTNTFKFYKFMFLS